MGAIWLHDANETYLLNPENVLYARTEEVWTPEGDGIKTAITMVGGGKCFCDEDLKTLHDLMDNADKKVRAFCMMIGKEQK